MAQKHIKEMKNEKIPIASMKQYERRFPQCAKASNIVSLLLLVNMYLCFLILQLEVTIFVNLPYI